jgi:hypothetical protein
LSSSDLAGAARRYAELPLADHRARQRKSEPAFVQYLGRAQLRTSPFSWYTAVAVGRWVDDAEVPFALPGGWHDRTQVDHALVRRLLAALVARSAHTPRATGSSSTSSPTTRRTSRMSTGPSSVAGPCG